LLANSRPCRAVIAVANPAQCVEARLQSAARSLRSFRPFRHDPPFALFRVLRRRERRFPPFFKPERPAARTWAAGVGRQLQAGTKARFELLRDDGQSGAPQPLEQLRQMDAMGRNMLVENGRSHATKVPAQIFLARPVGHGKAAGYANQQLMDDQPLGAKRDELVRRQTAIVAQLVRLGRGGRNVLGPENRRQRQILSRQLRFEAWIPSSVRRGSGWVSIVHLLVLVTNAIRYGAAAGCQLRAEQVLAVTEHAPDQMPNRSWPRILSNNARISPFGSMQEFDMYPGSRAK